jgi:hypothetical protein
MTNMKKVSLTMDQADSMFDYLCELRGQWAWRKNEVRCAYDKSYADLELFIEEIDCVIKGAQ